MIEVPTSFCKANIRHLISSEGLPSRENAGCVVTVYTRPHVDQAGRGWIKWFLGVKERDMVNL